MGAGAEVPHGPARVLLPVAAEHPEAVLDTEGELNGTEPVESAHRIADFTLSHRDTYLALARLAQHGQRRADHLFDKYLYSLISGVAALAQGSVAAPEGSEYR